jgi:hypothetical protein
MKLFLLVSGFQDCLKIQSDLNKLSEWCDKNSLLFNLGKCKTITFARSRHSVEFSYMLGGTVLDQVSSIACGRHGCKGLCVARIYQETFVGV